MKLKISQYIKREFAPGSEPDPRTIISAIQRGEIPGQKIGGQWFVDDSPPPSDLHPIAASILRSNP